MRHSLVKIGIQSLILLCAYAGAVSLAHAQATSSQSGEEQNPLQNFVEFVSDLNNATSTATSTTTSTGATSTSSATTTSTTTEEAVATPTSTTTPTSTPVVSSPTLTEETPIQEEPAVTEPTSVAAATTFILSSPLFSSSVYTRIGPLSPETTRRFLEMAVVAFIIGFLLAEQRTLEKITSPILSAFSRRQELRNKRRSPTEA
jgi:hypothetical protein